MFEGLGRWTPAPPAVLGWLLSLHAAPRLLSLGCADGGKEPSGKKPLSEKKLVRLLPGKGLVPSVLLTGLL